MKSVKSILSSKIFHSLLGVGVSVVLLGVIVFSVNWSQVWVHLRSAHLWALVPSLVLLLVHFSLRAIRWRYLLPISETPPTTRALFDAIMLGSFATFILPLRAGEFVRPFMLTRYAKLSFSSAFVSVVVERFFDLAVVLACFAIMLPFVPSVPGWVNQGAFALSLMALGLFMFLVGGALMPKLVVKLIDLVVRPLPAKFGELLAKFLKDFLGGALVLRSPLNLARIVGLSILLWISNFFVYYMFFFLFDIPAQAWMGVAVSVILALAVAAPSAPGFIGVYQAACIASFALFGVNTELAVAYSIITHVFQYLIFVIYGVYLMFKGNLRLRDLHRHAPCSTST